MYSHHKVTSDLSLRKAVSIFLRKKMYRLEFMSDANNIPSIASVLKEAGYNLQNKVPVYMHMAASRILRQHGGRVPDTVEQLLRFRGIGLKVATLIMQGVFGVTSGIVGDRHVIRFFLAYGFATPKRQRCRGSGLVAKSADEIVQEVQEWLPARMWKHVNPTIAGLAQMLNVPGSRGISIAREIACLAGEIGINGIEDIAPGHRKKFFSSDGTAEVSSSRNAKREPKIRTLT